MWRLYIVINTTQGEPGATAAVFEIKALIIPGQNGTITESGDYTISWSSRINWYKNSASNLRLHGPLFQERAKKEAENGAGTVPGDE